MALRSMDDAKTEAIERMKILKLRESVLKAFKEEREIYKSDEWGFLWNLTAKEQELVEQFEKKHAAVVYHVLHLLTDADELYSFLFVDLEDGIWRSDRTLLERGEAVAYVLNATLPECSEFGAIGIEESIGGVVRTW